MVVDVIKAHQCKKRVNLAHIAVIWREITTMYRESTLADKAVFAANMGCDDFAAFFVFVYIPNHAFCTDDERLRILFWLKTVLVWKKEGVSHRCNSRMEPYYRFLTACLTAFRSDKRVRTTLFPRTHLAQHTEQQSERVPSMGAIKVVIADLRRLGRLLHSNG